SGQIRSLVDKAYEIISGVKDAKFSENIPKADQDVALQSLLGLFQPENLGLLGLEKKILTGIQKKKETSADTVKRLIAESKKGEAFGDPGRFIPLYWHLRNFFESRPRLYRDTKPDNYASRGVVRRALVDIFEEIKDATIQSSRPYQDMTCNRKKALLGTVRAGIHTGPHRLAAII
ncbi:hypothetical protein HK102_012951, partial [Quaeritorhiza haematococci]